MVLKTDLWREIINHKLLISRRCLEMPDVTCEQQQACSLHWGSSLRKLGPNLIRQLMVLKCQTFMITTFRPYILHELERFILYIPLKWNPNSLPVNLCLSFLFLKGIFIKTKTVYLFRISRQSLQVSLEFLVFTVYCFRDWVSVFGFQFLNFNEMIERRARKDSPL